jgi:hypothetical protein
MHVSAHGISAQSSAHEKFFQKKYTHAEVVIIQPLPHVIRTYFSFKIPNLRRKNTKTPKIQHHYNI